MKNMKFWRTALVATLVLTVMLSVTGGTIAWFTDEVTSAANVIEAGNLDVELYHTNKTVANEKVGSSTELFEIPKLWEPGMVAWENLTVANEGNLALKYELEVNATDVVKTDDGHDLTEALKVAVVPNGFDGDRAAAIALTGYEALKSFKLTGDLEANEAGDKYGLVVYWEPTANDNIFNMNNDQTTVLTLNLGVKLTATQLMSESDSFDNTYDEDAQYTVTNAADLQEALQEGGTVILGDNVALSNTVEIPANADLAFDLNGNTLTANMAIPANAEVTIADGKIVNNSSDESAIESKGNMTLDDVTVESARHAVRVEGGETVINGGIYKTVPTTAKTLHALNVSDGSKVIVNGGTFIGPKGTTADSGAAVMVQDTSTVIINGGNFSGGKNNTLSKKETATLIVYGGTFDQDPSAYVPAGYKVTKNSDGTWTVALNSEKVEIADGATKEDNGTALADAINKTNVATTLQLPAGEYKMPSIGDSKTVTITGTKDTVIDNTMGAYLENSTVSFEGVTIKGSTGKANGNGSDYAALYTPNVTYTNCTFDGPFRIGRDGATFINCTFTNLGNDYVWTYGNDCTFTGCTFESEGKALLIYSDGGNEVSTVKVEGCTFNATQGAKASAIANQNCAAIEIHNYGNGVNLTTSGNTVDTDFSGEWRIKTYENGRPDVIVNGIKYTTIAIDGKLMTIDADKNVTIN